MKITTRQLRNMFAGGAKITCAHRREVDEMNVFPVPDGDTGTNTCMTLEKMVGALPPPTGTPKEMAEAAARGALLGARGNSGVIFSQILRGFSEGLGDEMEIGAISLAGALVEAADHAYQAVIKPVEGTILTVLNEAATAAELSVSAPDAPVEDILDAALFQARIALARTPQMLDKLREAGVVDAGGQALVYFLEGMLLALHGEIEFEPPASGTVKAAAAESGLAHRYCTELVIVADAGFADALRERLMGMDTDSLMVVGDAGAVKIHVHTDEPGRIIAMGHEGGELLDVKVDNMAHQHRERVFTGEEARAGDVAVARQADGVRASVVAVASGDGLRDIFLSLGADGVIKGGQTMNPSTEEIVEAIGNAPGDAVFLLPNNKNIILAANGAAEICKREVYVIPTTNAPQGFTALLEFDAYGDARDCAKRMHEAISSVSVAEITYAVRDTSVNGMKVETGDCIAVLDGEIRIVARSPVDALSEVMEIFCRDEREIISLYRGEEMSEEEAQKLADDLERKHENLEIELHFGGQAHYPLIVSAE